MDCVNSLGITFSFMETHERWGSALSFSKAGHHPIAWCYTSAGQELYLPGEGREDGSIVGETFSEPLKAEWLMREMTSPFLPLFFLDKGCIYHEVFLKLARVTSRHSYPYLLMFIMLEKSILSAWKKRFPRCQHRAGDMLSG